MKNKIFLTSLIAMLAVGPALADHIFEPSDTEDNCYGDPINNQTSGTVTYVADWQQCDCTEGANVANCTITGVTNNACNYSFNCQTGYTYNNQTSGSGTGSANEYSVTTPDCSGRGQYTIRLDPNYEYSTAYSGDSDGTDTLYTTYNTDVYLNSARTQTMSTSANPITAPVSRGHWFAGYYGERKTNGSCPNNANNADTYIANVNSNAPTNYTYLTNSGRTAGIGYTSNQTWYACWNYYNVNYLPGSCGGKQDGDRLDTATYYVASTLQAAGNELTVPTGSHFIGWAISQANANAGIVDYDPGDSLYTDWNVNGDQDLYAVCVPDTYNIVYNYGTCQQVSGTNGVYTDVDALTYGSGTYVIKGISDTNISAKIEEPTGYTFQGWSLTNGGSVNSNYSVGQHNNTTWQDHLVLYAVCDPNEITLKWKSNNSEISSSASSWATGAANASACTFGVDDDINPIGAPAASLAPGNDYIFTGWNIEQ